MKEKEDRNEGEAEKMIEGKARIRHSCWSFRESFCYKSEQKVRPSNVNLFGKLHDIWRHVAFIKIRDYQTLPCLVITSLFHRINKGEADLYVEPRMTHVNHRLGKDRRYPEMFHQSSRNSAKWFNYRSTRSWCNLRKRSEPKESESQSVISRSTD